jgi:hypothetical protein
MLNLLRRLRYFSWRLNDGDSKPDLKNSILMFEIQWYVLISVLLSP